MLVLEASRAGLELHPLLVQLVDTDGFFGKPFWWGLVGAVVGAVVGGLIGIGGLLLTFREQRKQKQEDRATAEKEHRKQKEESRIETEKAYARAVIFKLLKIQNTAYQSKVLIEQQLERGKKAGVTEPFAAVMPITNFISPVHFSIEEAVLVSSLNDLELDKLFFGLDDGFDALIAIWSLYRVARKELTAKYTPSGFTGALGETVLTPRQLLKLQPEIIEANDLVEQALAVSSSIYLSSAASLKKVIAGLNERYGSEMSIVTLDTGVDTANTDNPH